jgi:2,3-bisphosphoglycerate-dependent phosphoglycerate mutase
LETVEKHGKDQVQIWRRSYDIPPPELEENDARHPKNDKRYRDLSPELLPKTEVLFFLVRV